MSGATKTFFYGKIHRLWPPTPFFFLLLRDVLLTVLTRHTDKYILTDRR